MSAKSEALAALTSSLDAIRSKIEALAEEPEVPALPQGITPSAVAALVSKVLPNDLTKEEQVGYIVAHTQMEARMFGIEAPPVSQIRQAAGAYFRLIGR